MPAWGANNPFRHRGMFEDAYRSPYLLEILSTRSGAPTWDTATGTLTANTGQTVSCSRASSAYCLGRDGLLHLLGSNTVRVEPSGLLVEGASTNGCNNGASPGTWGTSGITVTTSATTAPDGTSDGVKLQCGAGTTSFIIWVNTTVSTTNPAVTTVYAKAGTANFLCVALGNSSKYRATFNLTDGSSSLLGGGATSASSVAMANGWYRLTVVGPPAVGDSFLILGPGDTAAHADAINIGTWTAAGTENVYVWGPQFEDSRTFVSSYIPTTTGPASRAADVVTVANPLPAGAYRYGVTVAPESGSFSVIGGVGVRNAFLSTGFIAANTFWLGNVPAGGGMYAYIWDNATGQRSYLFSALVATSHAFSVLSLNAGADPTVTEDGVTQTPATAGAGTNIITTQQTPLYLGNDPSGVQDGWGHFRDIYVNNT